MSSTSAAPTTLSPRLVAGAAASEPHRHVLQRKVLEDTEKRQRTRREDEEKVAREKLIESWRSSSTAPKTMREERQPHRHKPCSSSSSSSNNNNSNYSNTNPATSACASGREAGRSRGATVAAVSPQVTKEQQSNTTTTTTTTTKQMLPGAPHKEEAEEPLVDEGGAGRRATLTAANTEKRVRRSESGLVAVHPNTCDAEIMEQRTIKKRAEQEVTGGAVQSLALSRAVAVLEKRRNQKGNHDHDDDDDDDDDDNENGNEKNASPLTDNGKSETGDSSAAATTQSRRATRGSGSGSSSSLHHRTPTPARKPSSPAAAAAGAASASRVGMRLEAIASSSPNAKRAASTAAASTTMNSTTARCSSPLVYSGKSKAPSATGSSSPAGAAAGAGGGGESTMSISSRESSTSSSSVPGGLSVLSLHQANGALQQQLLRVQHQLEDAEAQLVEEKHRHHATKQEMEEKFQSLRQAQREQQEALREREFTIRRLQQREQRRSITPSPAPAREVSPQSNANATTMTTATASTTSISMPGSTEPSVPTVVVEAMREEWEERLLHLQESLRRTQDTLATERADFKAALGAKEEALRNADAERLRLERVTMEQRERYEQLLLTWEERYRQATTPPPILLRSHRAPKVSFQLAPDEAALQLQNDVLLMRKEYEKMEWHTVWLEKEANVLREKMRQYPGDGSVGRGDAPHEPAAEGTFERLEEEEVSQHKKRSTKTTTTTTTTTTAAAAAAGGSSLSRNDDSSAAAERMVKTLETELERLRTALDATERQCLEAESALAGATSQNETLSLRLREAEDRVTSLQRTSVETLEAAKQQHLKELAALTAQQQQSSDSGDTAHRLEIRRARREVEKACEEKHAEAVRQLQEAHQTALDEERQKAASRQASYTRRLERVQQSLTEKEAEVSALKEEVQRHGAALSQLAEAQAEWAQEKQQLQKECDEWSEKVRSATKAQQQLAAAQREVEVVSTALAEAKAELEKTRAQLRDEVDAAVKQAEASHQAALTAAQTTWEASGAALVEQTTALKTELDAQRRRVTLLESEKSSLTQELTALQEMWTTLMQEQATTTTARCVMDNEEQMRRKLQLQETENRVHTLLEERSILQSNAEVAANHIRELDSAVNAALEELEALRVEKLALAECLRETKASSTQVVADQTMELDRLRTQLEQMEEEKQAWSGASTALRDRIAELEGKIEPLQEALTQRQEELVQQQQQRQRMEEEHREALEALEAQQASKLLSIPSSSHDKTQQTEARMEGDDALEAVETTTTTTTVTMYQQQIQELEEALCLVGQQAEEFTAERDAALAALETSEAELARVKASHGAEVNVLRRGLKDRDALKAHTLELEEAVCTLQSQVEEATAKVRSLEARLQARRTAEEQRRHVAPTATTPTSSSTTTSTSLLLRNLNASQQNAWSFVQEKRPLMLSKDDVLSALLQDPVMAIQKEEEEEEEVNGGNGGRQWAAFGVGGGDDGVEDGNAEICSSGGVRTPEPLFTPSHATRTTSTYPSQNVPLAQSRTSTNINSTMMTTSTTTKTMQTMKITTSSPTTTNTSSPHHTSSHHPARAPSLMDTSRPLRRSLEGQAVEETEEPGRLSPGFTDDYLHSNGTALSAEETRRCASPTTLLTPRRQQGRGQALSPSPSRGRSPQRRARSPNSPHRLDPRFFDPTANAANHNPHHHNSSRTASPARAMMDANDGAGGGLVASDGATAAVTAAIPVLSAVPAEVLRDLHGSPEDLTFLHISSRYLLLSGGGKRLQRPYTTTNMTNTRTASGLSFSTRERRGSLSSTSTSSMLMLGGSGLRWGDATEGRLPLVEAVELVSSSALGSISHVVWASRCESSGSTMSPLRSSPAPLPVVFVFTVRVSWLPVDEGVQQAPVGTNREVLVGFAERGLPLERYPPLPSPTAPSSPHPQPTIHSNHNHHNTNRSAMNTISPGWQTSFSEKNSSSPLVFHEGRWQPAPATAQASSDSLVKLVVPRSEAEREWNSRRPYLPQQHRGDVRCYYYNVQDRCLYAPSHERKTPQQQQQQQQQQQPTTTTTTTSTTLASPLPLPQTAPTPLPLPPSTSQAATTTTMTNGGLVSTIVQCALHIREACITYTVFEEWAPATTPSAAGFLLPVFDDHSTPPPVPHSTATVWREVSKDVVGFDQVDLSKPLHPAVEVNDQGAVVEII